MLYDPRRAFECPLQDAGVSDFNLQACKMECGSRQAGLQVAHARQFASSEEAVSEPAFEEAQVLWSVRGRLRRAYPERAPVKRDVGESAVSAPRRISDAGCWQARRGHPLKNGGGPDRVCLEAAES